MPCLPSLSWPPRELYSHLGASFQALVTHGPNLCHPQQQNRYPIVTPLISKLTYRNMSPPERIMFVYCKLVVDLIGMTKCGSRSHQKRNHHIIMSMYHIFIFIFSPSNHDMRCGMMSSKVLSTLKGRGVSIRGHIHDLYPGLRQVPKSYFIDPCVCNLTTYIVLCQGENRNILVLDIHDENTPYVFASKGIHVAYLNFRKLQSI